MRLKYKINIFIITIFISIFFTILLMTVISKRAIPIFMDYAISEIRNNSIAIINNAISTELSSFDNNLMNISKNSQNDIQMVDFNSKLVNSILTDLTKNILIDLKKMETGKKELSFGKLYVSNELIYSIPLGRATNNIFIANLGPKIPIKLNVVGDIYSNIKTDIREYGINNALVEIMVNVTLTERVIMPFKSNEIKISVNVPISIKLIQGNIPKYYGSGISRNSNILSIPVE